MGAVPLSFVQEVQDDSSRDSIAASDVMFPVRSSRCNGRLFPLVRSILLLLKPGQVKQNVVQYFRLVSSFVLKDPQGGAVHLGS